MALLGLAWSLSAHADWGVIGAATKCELDGSGFTLAATTEVSEGNSGAVPLEEGFTPLSDGEHEVRCTVGDVLVSAFVSVFPPAARGMCMGAGYVSVDRFEVGSVPLFANPVPFNWSCGSEELLTRITVSLRDSRLRVETCREAGANDDAGKSKMDCTTESADRFRASFDCTRAATPVEKLICGRDDLSRLDHILLGAYREAMRFQKTETPLRRSQSQWLRKVRDACKDPSCLRAAYDKRITELRGLIPKIDPSQMGNY